MRTSMALGFAIVSILLAGPSAANAEPQFWRNGRLCQRTSSGYVVCRDAPGANAYVPGGRPRYDRERQPDPTPNYGSRDYGAGYRGRGCQYSASVVCP